MKNARGNSNRFAQDVDVTADGSTAWRLYDVKLDLEVDPGKDSFEVTSELRAAAAAMLGLPSNRKREDGSPLLKDGEGYGVRIVRKSCDARSIPPVFSYILDVDDIAINSATVYSGSMKPLKIRIRPKKFERVPPDWDLRDTTLPIDVTNPQSLQRHAPNAADAAAGPAIVAGTIPGGGSDGDIDERVLIVGLGPAGLFAALALVEAGVPVTVIERGQPVEGRGRDIGALFARRLLDGDSNLCYGEGGAGTWSDGKLTTRIGRNSDDVRAVLRALVEFGAPPEILVTGKPHLGTDRLVRILRNARAYLTAKGADLRFGTTVERVLFDDNKVDAEGKARGGRAKRAVGVVVRRNRKVKEVSSGEAVAGTKTEKAGGEEEEEEEIIRASAVVLAAGHSSRGLFEGMHEDGVMLRYQSFAAGFRIEHPQALLDSLQYGADLAQLAARGKGPLPVADYRLAHQCVGPIAAPGTNGDPTRGESEDDVDATTDANSAYSVDEEYGGEDYWGKSKGTEP